MKKIRQITFNITQSRRIKNFAKKNNVKEKELLDKYREVMHIIFQAWKKNHSKSEDISFRNFFLTVMKHAEFAFRLKKRKEEINLIDDHVDVLREALKEYEKDYEEITEIEKIVTNLVGGYRP